MRSIAKVRSLSWVLLHEILASGPDGVTGVKSRPLWELLGSLGVFGILFGMTVREYADPRSYFIVFFAYVTVMLSFTILPDTLDVREKRLELIRPRPIPDRVFFAAETVTLLAVVSLIATVLAVPAFIGATLGFALSWVSAAGLYAALLFCTSSVVTVWLCVLLYAARWLPLGRMRFVLQTALIVTIFGALMASLAMLADEGTGRVSLEAAWIRWLPTSWFVDAVAADALAARLGCLGIIAVSATVYLRLDPDSLYRRLSETTPHRQESGLALRLLKRIEPRRRQAVSTAGLVLTVSSREEVAWLRTLTFRLVAIAIFGLAMWSGEFTWTFILADVAFVAILDGIFLFHESSEPEAAWILQASPVSRMDVTAGVAWAARLRYALFPSVLMGIHLLWSMPAVEATMLLLAFLVVCAFLEVLGTRRFRLPLAKKSSTVSGLFPSMMLSIVGFGVFAILYVLCQFAMLAGAVGLSVVLGVTLLLRRRLTRP